jgi:hypothetical protein
MVSHTAENNPDTLTTGQHKRETAIPLPMKKQKTLKFRGIVINTPKIFQKAQDPPGTTSRGGSEILEGPSPSEQRIFRMGCGSSATLANSTFPTGINSF